MADGSIIIDTRVLDAGFKKGISGLKSLAVSGAKAIGVGIGVAAAALGAFAVKATLAAEADATANKRIEAIATSMGLYGDEVQTVTKRLTDLATKTALATGVDDGIIKSTQAKLLTFKELAKTADETGGAFDRATQAAIDLAAAGFGEAETNAVQLGKALQDPIKGITALARSGVTFTQQEKDKIKTLVESGKMLEAQELVLKAIETQVGGTAEATADSSERMKVAFGEITEAAGGPLLTVFDALAPQIIDALDEITPAVESTFGGLAKMLTGQGGEEEFSTGLQTLVESAADGIGKALPVIIQAATTLLVSLANAIPTLLPPLATALLDGIEQIARALPEILPALVEALKTVIVLLAEALTVIMPILAEASAALIPLLAETIGELAPIVIPLVIEALQLMVKVLLENIPVFAKAALALIMGLVKGIVLGFKTLFVNGFKLNKELLAKFKTWLSGSKLMAVGRNLIMGLFDGIKAKWQAVTAWLAGLGDKAKDAIGNIKDKFLGVGRAIVSGIREGITAAWDGLKEKLRALVSGLPAAAKKVLGIRSPSRVFADEIGKPAAQGIGVGFSKAMGGVYAKMQQAVTGEMGRFASVVTPSLQLRQAAVAGATNMTINYNQPVRTYSETVRAQRDLMRGLVTSV